MVQFRCNTEIGSAKNHLNHWRVIVEHVVPSTDLVTLSVPDNTPTSRQTLIQLHSSESVDDFF